MENGIYIYHRGTRLARIARELKIPVYYPAEGGSGWVQSGVNRNALLRKSINWGSLRAIPSKAENVLNFSIINAAKKVRAFGLFDEHSIPCPEWSESYSQLNTSLPPYRTIFARRDGLSGGAGIEIITPEARKSERLHKKLDELGGFDFFVGKISYQREFRLHVWRGKVIIEQVKYLPPGCENPIHNHTNGCKFSTQSIDKFLTVESKNELYALCARATLALGLDFGAVDIIQSQKDKFYVLEINTAPGIRTDYVENAYREAIRELIG